MSLNTEWITAVLAESKRASRACTHDCAQGRRCTCALQPARNARQDQYLAMAQYMALVVFVLSLAAAAAGFFN